MVKTNRYTVIVGIIFVILASYYIIRPAIDTQEHEPSGPLFRGYRSQVIRFDSLNLSVVEDMALNEHFEVEVGDDNKDDEYYETNSFLGAGRFYLSYGVDTDSTHYNYVYLSNETGRLNQFWERFGYYFNLSDIRLTQEMNSIRYDDDARGKHFGSYIDGKPVWSRVVEDAGDEASRDTSRVGVLDITYNSGEGELWLRTKYLQISKICESEDGAEVLCVLMIDEDSDIELFIDCKEKLENQHEFFISFFEAIGITGSVLDDFRFEERYAAYA